MGMMMLMVTSYDQSRHKVLDMTTITGTRFEEIDAYHS